jgi:hypothetical protein
MTITEYPFDVKQISVDVCSWESMILVDIETFTLTC